MSHTGFKKKTSIFIIPRGSNEWRGNEAGWITASGWAGAGQQLWGEALVATSDGVFSPQESMLFPRGGRGFLAGERKRSAFRRFIPEFLITAYKDIKLALSKPSTWPIEQAKVLEGKEVMLVWERHDLFPGPGRRLADKLGVPFIISVEAAVVWEANKWGVRRPFWGKWLERNVEAKSLMKADLVSCVSEEVMEKVVEMGISRDKVLVTPNRVDSSIFHPGVDGREIKMKYNLANKRVIGWTGSFRRFHGIDTVVMAFRKLNERNPGTVLMLVGDGLEFENVKELVAKLNLSSHVILTGKQPFTSIPSFLANFDLALVSANSAEGFHYSPLKLREYLASGKAIIAPRAGNLPELFKDGVDLLFYEAGDVADLADKMQRLLDTSGLRDSLEQRAKGLFEVEGTWVHELKTVCAKLEIPY